MKAKYEPLTDEQHQALADYAECAGADRWKARLMGDWLHADSTYVPADTYAVLQALRNSHGPSWLETYKLRYPGVTS